MPQQDLRIQLAQAGEGHGPAPADGHEGGAAHTAQEHGGHHAYQLGDIPDPGILAGNAVIVSLLLILFGIAATRKMAAIPSGIQGVGEWIVERMIEFTRGIIGPGGEKYVPLVGTIFFFILTGNLLGQIPYLMSPTANLSTTLALGLIVFFYVQYIGIRSNGIGGYLGHFRGPMWLVAPILFPIEVISELVKPFTLAMRLFGNIFGEDTVIIVLATLAVTMLPSPLKGVIPFQFPILLLGLLTSFVQALVFSLLTCIYISLMSHHDSEHEGHGQTPGHGHPGIEESGLVP